MSIRYEYTRVIGEDEFVDLLKRSTLAQRRPVDDPKCIKAMLEHADLLCTAWDGEKLIGLARSVTDFEYCCYLSDLAVRLEYQKQGIGQELIRLTQTSIGEQTMLLLLSAPNAMDYYPKLGFQKVENGFIIHRKM